jgi:acyl-[acyl-carrier-protein]-phospholipid O-acyltransferase/long-chain-fatty-acid--[acyl-carrier-protein] ligase
MVPLGAVEEFISQVWPTAVHAVVGVPDAKRGEQLVLVTDYAEASRAALTAAARDAGLPEIFVPRAVKHVQRIPVLGTGKTDYVAIAHLAAGEPSFA